MASFKYHAISDSGQKLVGVVEAQDEFEAAERVKSSVGGYIQSIKRVGVDLNIQLGKPKLNEKALSLSCSQFAILLRSGLPLARTVEIVAAQSADKVLKKIFTEVVEDVRSGFSLADSLEKRGPNLPVVFLETVRAGESSGTMEASFAKMEGYFEKTYKLKRKVKSALGYPIFLITVAVVVIFIVVNKVLPAFLPMFEGKTLPAPTVALLAMYNFVADFWYLLLGGLLLIGAVFYQYSRTQLGKENLSRLSLKIPIIGKVNVMNSASQFANTMSALLSAGLPMVRAMEITGKVVSNLVVGQSIAKAVKSVTEGQRLGDAMRENPYLPPLLNEMTAVGEESGSLEATLSTIGKYYDDETEVATTAALSKMEPIITVVMGGVVGFILLALYMPMMQMSVG
ncbi:MAG: type II secretion system F family protein [Oscillospiraceae bacterium]